MSDLEFMIISRQMIELRQADAEGTAPFWPQWMKTRWGRWLAKHWAPTARLWRSEVLLAAHREIEAREAAAAAEAMIYLQIWAEEDFSNPLDVHLREKLIGAWCKWRTHHERKCQSAGCAPLGSARWIEAQREALERAFQ